VKRRPAKFQLFVNGYVSREVTVDLNEVSAVQDDGQAGSAGGGSRLVGLLVRDQWIRVAASYDEVVREVFGDDRDRNAAAFMQQAIGHAAAGDPRAWNPWFPPSPDRDHLERMLTVLANAMGFESGVRDIVRDYLDGVPVLARIRVYGKRHFDAMTRACGMKPPEES
jgi:hypothetical protein